MAKRKTTKRKTKKVGKKQNLPWRRILWYIVLPLFLLLVVFKYKDKVAFFYSLYFNKFEHKKLKNTTYETYRINRIIGENTDKVFGIDISHYQRREDINWDSLSINKTIPIEFVLLRATMGNRSTDRHFDAFWKDTKKHEFIRGAYHFYRADEDPVLQANNFLANVKLESGDLPPVLDIEKIPKRKSKEKLIEDLQQWCKVVEKVYGEKPIIYTYYHYYKDYLKGHFDDYPLWLANYNDVSEPSPTDEWDFWQFTENGIVYGINVKVDVDVYNGGLWSLKRLTLD